MIDLYADFKPIRNKLEEFNVFDNLYVVREYLRAFNVNLSLDLLSTIEGADIYPIMPDFADFIIVNSIIYASELPCSKKLTSIKDRSSIIRLISNLSNKVSEININDDVWLWLRSFSENQNKQKIQNLFTQIFRHYRIYDEKDLRIYTENRIGMTYKDFLICSFWLYSVFSKDDGFCVSNSHISSIPKEYEKTSLKSSNISKVLSIISCPIKSLRPKIKGTILYDNESIFKINSPDYFKFPIIEYQNLYFCPVPQYIIKQVTEGFYHIIGIPDSGLSHLIGKGFEGYVGEILRMNNKDSLFTIIQEIIYKKGTNKNCKSSDWIVVDNNTIIFIECKTKRLRNNSKNLLSVKDELQEDISIYADGVFQLYRSYSDYKNGLMPGLPFNDSKVFIPILLIQDEFFLNVPTIKDEIARLTYKKLKDKQIDLSTFEEFKFQVFSSQYFESEIQIMTKIGFLQYLSFIEQGKIDNEFRSKIATDFYYDNEFEKEFINPVQNSL